MFKEGNSELKAVDHCILKMKIQYAEKKYNVQKKTHSHSMGGHLKFLGGGGGGGLTSQNVLEAKYELS